MPTPRGDYDATLAALADLVHGFEHAVMARCRVGIGMPGAISPATGLVKNANSTWLNGRPFRRDLERALGRPVALANDANCFALSEATDGAGAGARVVFGVILGTGVGGGIVVDGRLLAGPNAIAGEWGHNPLPWPRDDERPGPALLLRPRRLHRDLPLGAGAGPRPRASRRGLRTAPRFRAPEVAALRRGRRRGRPTRARAARRAPGPRARARDQPARSPTRSCSAAGSRGLPQLYERVPALWARWVFSDRVDTRLLPPVHGDASGVRGAAWLAATARRR